MTIQYDQYDQLQRMCERVHPFYKFIKYFYWIYHNLFIFFLKKKFHVITLKNLNEIFFLCRFLEDSINM